jgi:hypothetical protein
VPIRSSAVRSEEAAGPCVACDSSAIQVVASCQESDDRDDFHDGEEIRPAGGNLHPPPPARPWAFAREDFGVIVAALQHYCCRAAREFALSPRRGEFLGIDRQFAEALAQRVAVDAELLRRAELVATGFAQHFANSGRSKAASAVS